MPVCIGNLYADVREKLVEKDTVGVSRSICPAWNMIVIWKWDFAPLKVKVLKQVDRGSCKLVVEWAFH
jgi:hypothetical protein